MNSNDVCIIWDSFDSFRFLSVDSNIFVYKLAQAEKPVARIIQTTQLFLIIEVTNESMKTPIGYIFEGLQSLDATYTHTKHAAVGRFPCGYRQVKSANRLSIWESNCGLTMIGYDNIGEVITDLRSILDISLLK